MSEKVNVTIEIQGKAKKEVTADTVLCFTVEDAKEFLDGRVKVINANEIFYGANIPEPIFAETVGSMLAAFVETRQKDNPMNAAYNLHTIGQILEKKSEELHRGATPEQKQKALSEATENLLKALFR